MEGNKIRGRSESFLDFYSQAKLFYNSLAPYEQQHVKDAFSFELGKCKSDMVKYNAIDLLNHIDRQLAKEVAENIGSLLPEKNREVNSSKKSPALSMANTVRKPDTKSVAVLLNGKPNEAQLSDWIKTFVQHKINYSIVDKKVYPLNGMLKVTDTYDTADPCLFDAILLMSSGPIIDAPVLDFIETTYKHYKPLGLALDDHQALEKSRVNTNAIGVYDLSKSSIQLFIEGIAQVRFWDRN